MGEASGSFGRLWYVLGRLWESLKGFQELWEALGSLEKLWKALEGFGRLWDAFGRFLGGFWKEYCIKRTG